MARRCWRTGVLTVGGDQRVKHCFRVFWAWQEEAETRWLEQMALEGWSLAGVRGVRYTFVQAAPTRTVYRLDFQTLDTGGLEEYRQICEDLGWEYVTRQGNWIYLRRPYEERATELYSDNSSRLQRYRSQLHTILLALAPLWLFTFVVYPLAIGPPRGWWARLTQIGTILLTLMIVYAVVRIWGIMRRLQSSPKE